MFLYSATADRQGERRARQGSADGIAHPADFPARPIEPDELPPGPCRAPSKRDGAGAGYRQAFPRAALRALGHRKGTPGQLQPRADRSPAQTASPAGRTAPSPTTRRRHRVSDSSRRRASRSRRAGRHTRHGLPESLERSRGSSGHPGRNCGEKTPPAGPDAATRQARRPSPGCGRWDSRAARTGSTPSRSHVPPHPAAACRDRLQRAAVHVDPLELAVREKRRPNGCPATRTATPHRRFPPAAARYAASSGRSQSSAALRTCDEHDRAGRRARWRTTTDPLSAAWRCRTRISGASREHERERDHRRTARRHRRHEQRRRPHRARRAAATRRGDGRLRARSALRQRVLDLEPRIADVAQPLLADPSAGSVAAAAASPAASRPASALQSGSRLAAPRRAISVTSSPAKAAARSASRTARSRTPRCRCACRRACPRACSGLM